MDFELSEEQELLRAGLRQLLERECDISRVRSVAYEGAGRDAELWRALAEAGWLEIAVPEADGGAGLRFEDVMLVIVEAGRALAPVPLTTTLLAARSVARVTGWSARSAPLHRVISGAASITIALHDADRDQAGAAQRDGDGWRFDGSFSFVPHGPLADLVLIEAGRGLIMLPADAPGMSWTNLNTIDRTVPQYELVLNQVRVNEDDSLYANADARHAIAALRNEWTAALAAESFGAAERLLELSVAYAKERVQFGRPIGANQAVKARIADMGAAVEQMRAAVYHAAVKVDADAEDRAVAVALAKMTAASAGTFVGTQAIHVHGGVGYTWEHDAHLYFKRIKSNELLLGDAPVHLERIAQAVLS